MINIRGRSFSELYVRKGSNFAEFYCKGKNIGKELELDDKTVFKELIDRYLHKGIDIQKYISELPGTVKPVFKIYPYSEDLVLERYKVNYSLSSFAVDKCLDLFYKEQELRGLRQGLREADKNISELYGLIESMKDDNEI